MKAEIGKKKSIFLQINPDLPQSHALKGWYDSEGSSVATTSLSQRGGPGGMGGDPGSANIVSIGEKQLELSGGFSNGGKPEYFSTCGYITVVKKENALYMACPNENDGKTCNKKVSSSLFHRLQN